MGNPFERQPSQPERPKIVRCPKCGGTGKDREGNTCTKCNGSGTIRDN